MKKIYKVLLLIALGLCAGCGLTSSTETDYPEALMVDGEVVQTYAAEDKEGRLQTYYQMADGTWRTDDYSYLYKLELTGRMHNAVKDSTFICLSNSEDVSFSKVAWSMLSSNTEDRLDRKEVVIVELHIVEDVSPTPTPAPGQDQALPTTMIDGEIYFMSGMYSTTKPSEISRIKELMEQAEYLGTTTTISAKEYPSKHLESNCLEEGCGIYRCADGERTNFIVVRPDGLTYRYVSGWTKYQWFEGKLVNAGEQEYLKTGMPTATPTPTVTPAPTAVPIVQAPQYVLSKVAEELTAEEGEMLSAYLSVLEGLLYEEELPEQDVEVEFMYTTYPDVFSICDMDADGKDELYIAHIATYNAGMFSAIYGYDDGKLHRELLADTLLSFYDNGVLIQKAMHNHGMAAGEDSDFWPYTLFQYDSVTDSYVAVANVDAWDKSYAETDWDGKAFPEDADIDSDGRVYYVMQGTGYEWQEPIDNKEYQEWYDSCMEGAANRYKLPTVDLTKASIEELKRRISSYVLRKDAE